MRGYRAFLVMAVVSATLLLSWGVAATHKKSAKPKERMILPAAEDPGTELGDYDDSGDSEADEDITANKAIPLCPPPELSSAKNSNVLLVSTMDGKITALDPGSGGSELWSVDTAPGDMLSSTISQLEITNQAKWVRLIPSLGGGLYKFDGEAVEPVPLSAEALLRSSFKFADNTVITGGKESRTYGVEVETGRIR